MADREEIEARKIKDVRSDRTIYEQFLTDNLQRDAHMATVRRQKEGARPLSETAMKEAGMQNFYNINFLDAAQSSRRAQQPYWDLTHAAPNSVNVSINTVSVEKQRWEKIIQEAMNHFFKKKKKNWIPRSRRLHAEYVDDGVAPYFWPDKENPMPETLRNSYIKFAKDTSVESERWEIFYIEDDIPISTLWQRYQDASNSEKAGWSEKALEVALKDAAQAQEDKQNQSGNQNMRWQDLIKNNDLLSGSKWGKVRTVIRLKENINGKIDKAVFTVKELSAEKGQSDEEYLFMQDDFAEDWAQVLGMLFWDIGNGTIHSIRGHSVLNYAPTAALNQIRSKILNATEMNMGVTVQGDALNSNEPAIKNFGFIRVLQSGITPVENFSVDYKDSFNSVNMVEGVIDSNNAQARERTKQLEGAESANASSQLGQIYASEDQANKTLYLSQMACLLQEVFRRLSTTGHDDSKEFRKYIQDRNVNSKEVLKLDITIESGAASGQMSSMFMIPALENGMAMGRQYNWNTIPLEEEYISRIYGSDRVKEILPDTEQRGVSARRQAEMENDFFSRGVPMKVDMIEDDHALHMQEHLETSMQLIKMIREVDVARATQQEIPQEIEQKVAGAKTFFMVGLQHMQQHTGPLAKDETKKKEFQEIINAFNQVQAEVLRFPEFQQRPTAQPQPA